jgi:peptide methionine sulfoxide reductase MsrA
MDAPNYSNMGDHTETVQVDYDPGRITYAMNAVFYQNEQQRQLAMASKTALEQKIGRTVKTEVVPLRSFTMAEDYHQKYILKSNYDLKNEMSRIYPRHQDFVDSTAVARLNGYADGYGTRDQLLREIKSLGLRDEGKKVLTEVVRR